MKRNLIAMAVLALAATFAPVRARTRDIAFGFRMGAGFPGDVNRTHPASIPPGLMNTTNPVRLYGDPVIIDTATNSYRGAIAGDTAVTKIAGILVRPYPTQQSSGGMASAIGAAVPPTSGVVDVIEEGYVIARCNNFGTLQPTKGGAVFMRIAATAGALIQGGLTSAADAANTVQITNARWNGPTDANGITELQVWVQ